MVIGVASLWSRTAPAQRPSPVIGYLSVGTREDDSNTPRLSGLRQGLEEAGYVEGRNVAIEYRWAHGEYSRLSELASELIRRPVSAIVTAGTPPTMAARAATSTVPVVFVAGIDPVKVGLAASLRRPGGNLTGVAIMSGELAGKRLDLLRDMLPAGGAVAVLVNEANAATEDEKRSLQDVAHSLGFQVHILGASSPSEIDAAFRALGERRPRVC